MYDQSFWRLPHRASVAVFAIFAGLCVFALTACAGTRGGSVPYNVEGFGRPDTPAAATLDSAYRIAPLDKLDIRVFKFEDLSGEYQVDLMGNVSMPLVGAVPASNMTTTQFKERLATKLGEKYLQSPDVSVAIKESTRSSVTVDGAVRTPGLYPVNGPTTLIQAIAMARGTDQNSNPRRVAIFRTIDGQRMAAAFDLTSIRRGEAEDPTIYGGDVVVVDGSTTRAVYRDILQSLPLISLFRPF